MDIVMKNKGVLVVLIYLLLLSTEVFSQSEDSTNSFKEGAQGFDRVIDNLDYKNTDIRDVIRSLATMYDLNIFIDNSINFNVTLHLSNVKVYDIIDFIVREHKLRLEETGSILKILPAEVAPPKPKEVFVEYENGLLSVDFKNEEIEAAMRYVAQKSGETILLDKYASGKITGLLQKVPFDIGLKGLLDNNGFLLDKNKDIYTVKPAEEPFTEGEGKAVRSRSHYVQVEDSLISMDVQNATFNQLVQEAARKLDKNIFIYGKLDGSISARVEGLLFEDFLNFLFQGSNYTYKVNDSVYLIGDKSVKGISSSELIKLDYLKTDVLEKLLPQSFAEKAELKYVTEQNGVMVIGTNNIISDIKDYIKKIDRPSPQILIEALVIDFNNSKLRDISVNAGYNKEVQTDTSHGFINKLLPGIDLLFNSQTLNRFIDKAGNFLGVANVGKLPDDFYMQIKALESEGMAQIRSRPQIATLNGYPADISIGQTQYYKLVTRTPYRDPSQIYLSETETFQTIEANVSLKITPWVSASGEITAEIHPEFRTPVGSFNSQVPPTIQSRSLNSTVRLRDGETIVLGGLIRTAVEESTEGVPIIRDVPLIGFLFESKNYNKYREELIIYVTPHLYYMDE
jgi:type IV pilus assembly protein PilQ